jgi:hypothetical protein
MTLVKSAPKKVLAKELFYQLKIGFLAKTFLGALYFTNIICTFRNQYEKTDFLMPLSTYSKKKSFYLLEGIMNFFEN